VHSQRRIKQQNSMNEARLAKLEALVTQGLFSWSMQWKGDGEEKDGKEKEGGAAGAAAAAVAVAGAAAVPAEKPKKVKPTRPRLYPPAGTHTLSAPPGSAGAAAAAAAAPYHGALVMTGPDGSVNWVKKQVRSTPLLAPTSTCPRNNHSQSLLMPPSLSLSLSLPQDVMWERYYNALLAYRHSHGSFDVPYNVRT